MRLFALILVVIVALAGGYGGTAYYIGGTVADAVDAYQRRLLTIDGMSVTRLTYDRRLLGGEVDYDITWRPAPGHPVLDMLAEVAPAAPKELRVAGKVPVRHGPWVGAFAAARAELRAALPDGLRPLLPKYPGQTPWLVADAVMDWKGATDARVAVVDYAGPLGSPDTPVLATLVVEGLKGRFKVARDAALVEADVTLAKLQGTERVSSLQFNDLRLTSTTDLGPSVAVKSQVTIGTLSAEDNGTAVSKMTAGPLRLNADMRREWSYLWSGPVTVRLENILADVDGRQGSLSAFVVESDLVRKGDLFDTVTGIELGLSKAAGLDLPGVVFRIAARNIEGAPVNALLEAAAAMVDHDLAGLLEARLPQLGARLLAAGPVVAIDPLALSVSKPRDIALTTTIGVPAGTQGSFDRPELLVNALESRVSLTVSLKALEELFLLAARAEKLESGNTLKPAEEAVVRERYARVRSALLRQPLFSVEEDRLGLSVRVSKGNAEVNGKQSDLTAFVGTLQEVAMDVMQAFLSDGDRRAPPAPRAAPAPAPAAKAGIKPNAAAAPAFGHLLLSADAPRPPPARLNAGGDTALKGELGEECIGHIDLRQPDLTLAWGGGTSDLLIEAESFDDTALIVRTPDGQWLCNDDGNGAGFDPVLQIKRPQRGIYAIWVATVEDAPTEATVTVSAGRR